MKQGGRVENFQADDLPVLPVHDHHGAHPFGHLQGNRVAAGIEGCISQVDVGRVYPSVVADTHAPQARPSPPQASDFAAVGAVVMPSPIVADGPKPALTVG